MCVIEIFSMRANAKQVPDDYLQIRCDRKSVLGNPFYVKDKSVAERNRVCDEFDAWLVPNLNDARRKELTRIYRLAKKRNIALMCWCAPLRCHCNTIKRVLDKKLCRSSRPSLLCLSAKL